MIAMIKNQLHFLCINYLYTNHQYRYLTLIYLKILILFSREPRLYKRVCPSVLLLSWRADTSRRTTYFVYTNLLHVSHKKYVPCPFPGRILRTYSILHQMRRMSCLIQWGAKLQGAHADALWFAPFPMRSMWSGLSAEGEPNHPQEVAY